VVRVWEHVRARYNIKLTESCSTHIHISLRDFSFKLAQARRLASAVIYFEAAFNALVPPNRRDNTSCESNWLTSPFLALAGLDRVQSIEAISRESDCPTLVDHMQERGNRLIAWNFDGLGPWKIDRFRDC
jgi:hypothetical protein